MGLRCGAMHGRTSRGLRTLIAVALSAVGLTVPQAASAAIDDVFGGDVDCQVQGDGVRFCSNFGPDVRSTTKTFDGVPIDVDVGLPAGTCERPRRRLPAGDDLPRLRRRQARARHDAALPRRRLRDLLDDRPRLSRVLRLGCLAGRRPGGCAHGYVRLIDTRYEVRDAQLFAGKLVDEGLVAPTKLAAIGGSYGGGMSLALAALRNRTMQPDGSLVPWTSPDGVPLELAAAAPLITWSDLAYSLTPNGSTLDYVTKSPYRGRFGVMKESLINGPLRLRARPRRASTRRRAPTRAPT